MPPRAGVRMRKPERGGAIMDPKWRLYTQEFIFRAPGSLSRKSSTRVVSANGRDACVAYMWAVWWLGIVATCSYVMNMCFPLFVEQF